MKVVLTIPTEHQDAFRAFLDQHPKVVVEQANYTQPGAPMSLDELDTLLEKSWVQACAGQAIGFEEFKARAAKW